MVNGHITKMLRLVFYFLTSETVQGFALTLEGVDDIHGRHSLTTSVLGVSDGITNNILQKDLEDTSSLFVNETGDTLDTTTTSQTTNGGFGNTLDVITKDLAVTLGSTLSESFTSFSTSGHFELLLVGFVCFWHDARNYELTASKTESCSLFLQKKAAGASFGWFLSETCGLVYVKGTKFTT
jgi:hypothetical protein